MGRERWFDDGVVMKNPHNLRFSVGDKVMVKSQKSAHQGKTGIVARLTDRASRFIVRFSDGLYVFDGKDIILEKT